MQINTELQIMKTSVKEEDRTSTVFIKVYFQCIKLRIKSLAKNAVLTFQPAVLI